jgi:hypothetical protein
MRRAAIGVRMHSGWGALVAVSNDAGAVEVLERQRIAVTASGARGGNQPYHFAKNLRLAEAEKFLEECFEGSKCLALSAVRAVTDTLCGQYQLAGAAVLQSSSRPLPALAKILAAHSLIHAAEGEFYREVFSKACASLDIPVTGLRERDLNEHVREAFADSASRVLHEVSDAGRTLGPPWTADQKLAALAALVVLANEQRRSGPVE